MSESETIGEVNAPPLPGQVRDGDSDPAGFPYAKWGVATALLATMVSLTAGILASLPILLIDSAPDDGDTSLWAIISLQILTGLSFLLVPFLVSLNYGGGFPDIAGRLGFHRFRIGQATKWIFIGIGAYIAFVITYSVILGSPEQDDFTGDFGPIWVQALLIVLLAPISEEVCFRGMLFGGIRNRLPMWPAALLAGVVFGLLHATTGWSAVPVLIFFGMVLAVVYEKTGSIWPPIIIHMLNNAIALTALNS